MVQFINEKGEVFVNRIDEEFELYTVAAGGFANQELRLSANQMDFYSHRAPFENCIQSFGICIFGSKKPIPRLREN